MSSGPVVSKRHASRLSTVHHKMTPACFGHPCPHDPMSRIRRRSWGRRSGGSSYRGKNPPHLPAHRSGPGPTTRRAYVWPRPGASYRCTKVGALLLTPLLAHRQSEPPTMVMHNRAGKGSRREAEGTRQTKQRQGPRPQRSDGRSRFPWQGPLPGQHALPMRPFWSWSFVVCFACPYGFGFSLASLSCLAHVWSWQAALTARAQVKGSKSRPLLLYTDKSPRAWATHKRNTLLGQAQNGARAVGADFTAATVSSTALLHDPR